MTYNKNGIKYVRICESLLRDFYGNKDLDKPTDAFEECGAWNSPDEILTPNSNDKATATYTLGTSENPRLVFPKVEFANAAEFYSNFNQAAIPFMSGFAI